MFSFFKGSRLVDSQPTTESLVYLGLPHGQLAIILQSRKSLEILRSHTLRLLVDSQLFSAFDHLFRQGHISTRPKDFFNTLFDPNFLKRLRTFFENSPVIFRVFTLPLKIPDKAKLDPQKLHKIVLHPSEILRPKTKIPRNFT